MIRGYKNLLALLLIVMLVSSALPNVYAQFYAKILDVKGPSRVDLRDSVVVTVKIEYNFERRAYLFVGIYDWSSGKWVAYNWDYKYSKVGRNVRTYKLEFHAPGKQGVYRYSVVVFYKVFGNSNWNLADTVNLTITVGMTSGRDQYEPDNKPEYAKSISPGESQVRSISPAGDVDWVRFVLNRASRVIIYTSGNGEGDTVLELYNDDFGLVAMNDDYGNSFWSRIEVMLNPGIYFVKVKPYNKNGVIKNYILTLEIEGNGGSSWSENIDLSELPKAVRRAEVKVEESGTYSYIINVPPITGSLDISFWTPVTTSMGCSYKMIVYDPENRVAAKKLLSGREMRIIVGRPMQGLWRIDVIVEKTGDLKYCMYSITFSGSLLLKERDIGGGRRVRVELWVDPSSFYEVGKYALYYLNVSVYKDGRVVGTGGSKIEGDTLKEVWVLLGVDRRTGPEVYFDTRNIVFLTQHWRMGEKPSLGVLNYMDSVKKKIEEAEDVALLKEAALSLFFHYLSKITIVVSLTGNLNEGIKIKGETLNKIYDIFGYFRKIYEKLVGKKDLYPPPDFDPNKYTTFELPVYLAYGLQKTSSVKIPIWVKWYKEGSNKLNIWVKVKINKQYGYDYWIEPAQYTIDVSING